MACKHKKTIRGSGYYIAVHCLTCKTQSMGEVHVPKKIAPRIKITPELIATIVRRVKAGGETQEAIAVSLGMRLALLNKHYRRNCGAGV
jgi:hypothetical protein